MEHFTGPRGGDDTLGSAMNSQAHRINMAMTLLPQTLLDISNATGIGNLDRIRQHMRWQSSITSQHARTPDGH